MTVLFLNSATQTSQELQQHRVHARPDGDSITISTVNGMTDLNGNTYTARRIDATTLDLYTGLPSAKDISGMTNANPVVVTTTTSLFGLSNGTKIAIQT